MCCGWRKHWEFLMTVHVPNLKRAFWEIEPYVECFLKQVKIKRWHLVLDGVIHSSLKRLMNRRVDGDTDHVSKMQVWVHISRSSPEKMKNAICWVCVLMSHNLISELPINTRIIRINLLLKMTKNHSRMSFFFLNPLLLIFIFPSHPISKTFCSVLSSFSPIISFVNIIFHYKRAYFPRFAKYSP